MTTKTGAGTIKYYSDFRRVIPDSWVRTYVFLPRLPCCTFQTSFPSCKTKTERCSIRLACLIHAASIHPELGSNSNLRQGTMINLRTSALVNYIINYVACLYYIRTRSTNNFT